jgi:hypothetical protein
MELSDQKIISPVDTPALCVPQEPHFKSPSRRVELSQLAVNFEKNCLGEVFGFSSVA